MTLSELEDIRNRAEEPLPNPWSDERNTIFLYATEFQEYTRKLLSENKRLEKENLELREASANLVNNLNAIMQGELK